MRTQGKDFDRYCDTAEKNGVRIIRSRVHSVVPEGGDQGLALRYMTEENGIEEERFDMVVLSTGLEVKKETTALLKRTGISLDRFNFIETGSFSPVSTSMPGVYACGVLTGPKDIPLSVMESSAAASAATENLSQARNTKTKEMISPVERDVLREYPRIGVFVCNCGTNIGGVVNVPAVAEYARTLAGVVYVEENLFTCSQDTQDKMAEVIKSQNLNRVVVAACTPKTHEALFQETLVSAGLNKYLIEMANIRNHDAWVHSREPEKATQKAKELVHMAASKAFLLKPLFQEELPVTQSALVAGGGVAGLTAALSLARQGFWVHLVEKQETLGGNSRLLYKTFLDEAVPSFVKAMIKEVQRHDLITVHMGAEIKKAQGFVGNFTTTILADGKDRKISHGVAILATGARESTPTEYLYGEHENVMTHLEMDALFKTRPEAIKKADTIVFIQCVGSREEAHPYCSKVCCTHAIKNAIAAKKANPHAGIYILYRDIRTYGTREVLYKEARDMGILFFNYTKESKPIVTANGSRITVEFDDPIIGKKLAVDADILALAARIDARDTTALTRAFKVASDGDGWLLEAHQKLRPVEFATDGVFLAGMAHYPKPIDESIAQAKAAASKALTTLSRSSILVGGVVSKIDPDLCSGCMGCIDVCPYGAISMDERTSRAKVNEALCKGCGACASACVSEAVTLMGFNNQQLYSQIKSAMSV